MPTKNKIKGHRKGTSSNKGVIEYDSNLFALTYDKLSYTFLPVYGTEFNYDFIKANYREVKGTFEINQNFHLKIVKPKKGNKDSNYRFCYNMYRNGKYIGNIYTDSSESRGIGYVKFSFYNKLFYLEEFDPKYYRLLIQNILKLDFNNVTALDIAYDAPGLLAKFKNVYLASNKRENHPDSDFKPYYKGANNLKITAFYNDASYRLGASEKKYIKFYNKSLDAIKKDKPYITEWHHWNIMYGENDRCELSLIGSKTFTDYNITLEQIESKEGIYAIFERFTKDSLRFIDEREYTWVNGNKVYKQVQIIDYSTFKGKNIEITSKVKSDIIPENQNERRIKAAFKQPFFNWLQTGTSEDLLTVQNFKDHPLNCLKTAFKSNNEVYKELIYKLSYAYNEDINLPLNPSIRERLKDCEQIIFNERNFILDRLAALNTKTVVTTKTEKEVSREPVNDLIERLKRIENPEGLNETELFLYESDYLMGRNQALSNKGVIEHDSYFNNKRIYGYEKERPKLGVEQKNMFCYN